MRKQIFAVVILCSLTLFAAAQKYHPDYQDGALWLKLKPSEEILTKKKEKLTVDDIRVLKPLKEKYQLNDVKKPFQKIQKASPLQNTYLLTFDKVNEADRLIKELEKSGVLEYAEKIPLNKSFLTPNDYNASTQWHLAKINALGAWDKFSSGSNVVIAIVDDAVQTTHPDLLSNIWVNPGEIAGNGIDDDGNGYVDDMNGWNFHNDNNNPNPPTVEYGHGTHVAGIASAASNNATGVAAIGFSAKLMCLRTSNAPRTIAYGYDGILYAADNGAHVINLSWGGASYSITAQRIINYAISQGCIVVAAAGNSGAEGPLYPAAYNGVISVAATDQNDNKASFSNYGSGITICAPGNNILSTTVGGGYGNSSGTSMASPMVAGLVALMQSYNPFMTDADLLSCLKSSATNIENINPSYAGKLGSGRINAEAAMQCISATLTYLPKANFSATYDAISAGGRISFTDQSSYKPTSWSWSFTGGSPATSNEQNPANVIWNTPGTYPVTLTVANDYGSHSKTMNVTVNAISDCESLNLEKSGSWSMVNYGLGSSGWLNGVNALNDKQRAMYFDASFTPAAYISNVWIWFVNASTSDLNKVVTVNAYDGTSGAPGSLLGSAVLSMEKIIENASKGALTKTDFLTPVMVPASRKFFISVDFSELCWNCPSPDNLNIVSNADGETIPSDTWVQLSDDSWHRYTTQNSWPVSISLFIHPSLTNQPTIATFIPSATTICAGNSVSFDASGSTYQSALNWSFVSGVPASVSGNPTPTVLFNTPGIHKATLTVQGGGCNDIRSSTISINVNENVTPSVSLSSNTTAPDVPLTFTATATNGGDSPVFAFKKNGQEVQIGNSDKWVSSGLAGGDEVSCKLISDYPCVTDPEANSNSIVINDVTMTVLPVELLYFKGNSFSGTNLLQWATTSEFNTDKFIVERSADGARFTEIGKVNAKGESNTTITYQFQNNRSAAAYYRLRILDKDGSFKFSQVIYLVGNRHTGIILWPNPATVGQEVQLLLTGRNAKQEIVQVIDAFGKVVYKKTVAIKGGILETGIPTHKLTSGLYFITITDETIDRVQYKKLMIVK